METEGSNWRQGRLVLVGDRLAMSGDEGGGFHCGDSIEVEVAPGLWIRGGCELDHSMTTTRLIGGGNLTGDKQEYPGWYLNIGLHDSRILLIPGMKARRWLGFDWPEPTTPYEGQTYRRRYGGWHRYTGGQWVKEPDQE